MQIAILLEDKEFVDSSMDGSLWKAGKFAFSLRLSLWTEHLGLNTEEVSLIINTIEDIWLLLSLNCINFKPYIF